MREIKPLTSLRGIAAMAVVMQHFSATAQEHCRVTIPSLVPHGYIAVDLFFALSGFIMSYTYAAAFETAGLRRFPDFLARRVARVVPLNLAVLAGLAVAGSVSVALLGRNIFFSSADPAYDFATNALMLQGLGIGANLNGPSWSISTEFMAYLAFPLFIAAAFGRRAAALLLLAASAAAVCSIALQHPRLGLDTGTPAAALLRCFAEFAMGMVAYRVSRNGQAAALLGRDGVAFGLAASCLGAMALRVDLPAVLLFPVLIASLACNRRRMAAAMSTRLPHFLGVVSYSLYLIHSPFRPLELMALRALHPLPLGAAGALAFALAGSLSVVPFAWVSYQLIEQPGRRFAQRLLLGRPMVSAT